MKITEKHLRRLIKESLKPTTPEDIVNLIDFDIILMKIHDVLKTEMISALSEFPETLGDGTDRGLELRGEAMKLFVSRLHDFLLNFWIQDVDDELDGFAGLQSNDLEIN